MSNIFKDLYGHKEVFKAIFRSQHCQRNWDLTKEFPEEDLELLKVAATQCPSKQNKAYYKVHFITNRSIIEAVHETTKGFNVSEKDGKLVADVYGDKTVTNSQVLANLLIVLEDYQKQPLFKNFNLEDINKDEKSQAVKLFDRNVAVGVAAGYLNVVASLLGYSTGCCSCMTHSKIKEILDLENEPLLLMGIGFKDETRNRRVHEKDENFIFPTKPKQDIPIKIWD